jgi:diacylglycerol kinase family enzyme
LGERLNGIQEVSGSIPLGSTNLFSKSVHALNDSRLMGGFFVFARGGP